MTRDGDAGDAGRRRVETRRANEGAALALFETPSPRLSVACECGGSDCDATLTVSPRVYRGIRRHGSWFVVAGGHELPDVERVVKRHGELVIVESRGARR